MSMFSSVKDVVFGQAMKLMSDPRVSKVLADPRLMNAAMKAVEVGGNVKQEVDKVSRLAAGALGWASRQEVDELKGTIQTLQDTVVGLENRAATAESRAKECEAKLAPASAAPSASAPAKSTDDGKAAKGGAKKTRS